ncbi:MAG: Eco57I restriction-modification methylase domain-containing protein [Chloroflexales bacterium]
MLSSQLPFAAAQLHYNQQLFSDYYLDHILPRRADWRLLMEDSAQVLAQVRAIYAGFTPSSIEAQTEEDLIKPVLAALGHSFEVQAALKTPDGTKRPDYVFYRDLAARDANKKATLDDSLSAQGALAIGDAKFWDRPLDTMLVSKTGDPFSNKNPSYQIAFYIQHSGLAWGILTNGRRWRLYHKDTAHKLDRFYEVDLPELLDRNDPAAFLFFYGFFRRAAFDPHPLGLDTLLESSMDFARGISENLKRQVYTALRHLVQGFLDYTPNGLGTSDVAPLSTIYDHCLIVLYRLLFALYAEARDLLPMRESESYRRFYSLDFVKREVADNLDSGLLLLADSATFWPRLRTLFGIINAGSPPLKVSTFNGGLFDPNRYPFLETQSIGDAHLLQALDLLTRVNRQFVDYRDLAERHLGTIYEGLLEYHLEALPQEERTEGFSIDLFNSEGERHRTGSYYTPDFVVQYIITETLRPILDAAVAGKTSDAEKAAAVLAVNVLDPSMGSGHFPVAATEYMARYLVELNVAPPPDDLTPLSRAGRGAGGEGLSEKVTYLMIPPPQPSPDGGGSPAPPSIGGRLGGGTVTFQTASEGVPARGAGAKESDLAYWKRRVAQNCIYGVDLNPLAVDLSKLSLWLSTAAKDKPLSFLDHHLRCGNAVVGARITDSEGGLPAHAGSGSQRAKAKKEVAAGQLSMLDDAAFTQRMSTAVGSMWLIEQTLGNTMAEVKEQEHAYQMVREALTRRYAQVADVATAARGFGLTVDRTLWPELVRRASGGNGTIMLPAITRMLAEATSVADVQRFFHWDLEFPEVFFDRFGRPLGAAAGFDVVIGNPPYVRQEQISSLKPYFQQAYAETYSGSADLFVYFYHQGVKLLREGGRMSYIVTNKWLRASYGEALRGFFAEQTRISQVIDFGHAPIFAEADVFPCIIVLEKPAISRAAEANQTGEGNIVQVTDFPREALKLVNLADYVDSHHHPVPQSRLGRSAWSLGDAETNELMEKIRRAGLPLTEFAWIKPYYGIKTGFNEAFLIDTPTKERLIHADPRSAEIIKPYLRGQDVKRWSPEWNGMWMIFAGQGVVIPDYPAIEHHLAHHRDALEKRAGTQEWWQFQSTSAFHHLYAQPKIFYPDITWRSQFSLDTSGYFSNNTVYFLPTDSAWLITVLNSSLMWWFAWRRAAHGKDEALRFFNDFVEQIPIAPATDDMLAKVEPAVARLIAITKANQESLRDTRDWLRMEFGIEQAGQKLSNFARLSADEFITEVKKRRLRSAGMLTPATLKALRTGYTEQATPIQQRASEALGLERRLASLVNAAYGLTPEDVEVLWRSAPPRMPVE